MRSFRVFDNLAVYTVRRICYAYDGGETAEKSADINTRISFLPPPQNAKNLCHKRICRH
jgi:hypothetical protein